MTDSNTEWRILPATVEPTEEGILRWLGGADEDGHDFAVYCHQMGAFAIFEGVCGYEPAVAHLEACLDSDPLWGSTDALELFIAVRLVPGYFAD